VRVPVQVELEPQSPRRYEIGVGYGTDTGFRGGVGADLRRLNRDGHRAQVDAQLAFVQSSATARYLIPRPFGVAEMLTFFGGYQRLSPQSSRSDKIRGGLSLSDRLAGGQHVYSLVYEHESFDVGPDTGRSDLLMLETSWRKSAATDVVFPTKGFEVTLELRGAEDALFSSTSFLQLYSRAALVLSLTSRTRLIARGELGAALTARFSDLPASLRFFAGGDESVRGYAYRSLGPRDADGELIGGDRLLTASIELERRLFADWGVAAFFDAGNAFDSFSLDLERGAGLGLRWISPIGQVRVDGAFAVSAPGNPFRLHLRIGPDL
jgi:translocation and assembly module TamA